MNITVDRSQPRNYESKGLRYFSVTSICHEMYGADLYGDQAAMDRGTDLHTIFALEVAAYAGRCQPPMVPSIYAGYHQSMMLGIEWMKPEPVYIERPSLSAVKGMPFAGTPDLLAWVRYRDRRVLAVIDLKTGHDERWHSVQVMAYGKLKDYLEAQLLGIMYINDDGKMPIFRHVKRDPRDWTAFQSALNLLIWRESH